MKRYGSHRRMLFFIVLFLSQIICAQNYLRIHYSDGNRTDIPVADIDSVTFVKGDSIPDEAELTGSWLWGSTELGYYELLTINPDHTYTGYDNFFVYGFDAMTYGWYSQQGSLLFLQSNGYGYNRRYTWFVMGLTRNALDVMTKTGHFTYYRLQAEAIRMRVGETLPCGDGETYSFTDGVIVKTVDGNLQALSAGISYVLKKLPSNFVFAYKVVVE